MAESCYTVQSEKLTQDDLVKRNMIKREKTVVTSGLV